MMLSVKNIPPSVSSFPVENEHSKPSWFSANKKVLATGALALVALASLGAFYQDRIFNPNVAPNNDLNPNVDSEKLSMSLGTSKRISKSTDIFERETRYERALADYQAGNLENLDWAQRVAFNSRDALFKGVKMFESGAVTISEKIDDFAKNHELYEKMDQGKEKMVNLSTSASQFLTTTAPEFLSIVKLSDFPENCNDFTKISERTLPIVSLTSEKIVNLLNYMRQTASQWSKDFDEEALSIDKDTIKCFKDLNACIVDPMEKSLRAVFNFFAEVSALHGGG